MSEDRCPFCDRTAKPWSSNSEDHCMWVGEYAQKLKGVRSISCYEAQLSRQQEMLGRMRKILEECGPVLLRACQTCNDLSGCVLTKGKYIHEPKCIMTMAQIVFPKITALLAELEELKEKKE